MNILPISHFEPRLPSLLSLLRDLVRIESPSTGKPSVDRLGRYLIPLLRELGADVQVHPQAAAGDHITARWGEGSGESSGGGSGGGSNGILILSHMDTVYDLGTLARQPFRAAGGRIYGPGVLDMKASIAMLLVIMQSFREAGLLPARPLTALFTSDEETGSDTSRALIESLAREADLVLCLEPALASGAIKTARKGTGGIEIRAAGAAAHAGIDHAKGRNAIEELAHHVLAAQKLTDYSRGTTVNVGVIRGGTRGNVVPGEASATVDFRVSTPDEIERLRGWAAGLTPVLEGTSVSAEFSLNRPPMPRDATMAHTFARAREIAAQLGLDLQEGSTGGGSDANFVAPLGVPVLDGLGPVGDGAHSEREYVLAGSIPERAALLATLLLNW